MNPTGPITDFDGIPTISGLPGADTVRDCEAPGRLESHCPREGNAKTDDACPEVEPWQPEDFNAGRCVPNETHRGRGGELATPAKSAELPTAASSPAAEPAMPPDTFGSRVVGLGDGERYDAGPGMDLVGGAAVGSGLPDVRAGVLPEEISGRESGRLTPGPDGTEVPWLPHESEPPRSAPINSQAAIANSQALIADSQAGRGPREAHLRLGLRNVWIVTRAKELQACGQSLEDVGVECGVSASTVCRLLQRSRQMREISAAGLAARTWHNGSRPRVPELSASELARVQQLYAQTNRTRESGSTVEALLQAMEQGFIRPAMCELIRNRMSSGQSPLTERQMRRLRIAGPVIKAGRAPRRTWLEHVSSPGALQVDVDAESGEETHIAPGQRWTIDDGSINLLVMVPGLEIPGDKCWERWGVVVGRFQLLLTVDHRTRCIVGWSYTCRPRDAYRAEDLVGALQACVAQHGAPREIVLEKGISAARLVSEALGAAGIRIIRASSPHQKVVESVFNVLWTALSTLPGQVGRTRGENERMSRWLQACHEGRRDPRGELMTLEDFLTVLDAAIARCNERWVDGRQGRWQPRAWFEREAQKALRRVAPEDLWMFAPTVAGPVQVDWTQVKTSVAVVPGRSEQFVFGEPWLDEWHGARVKLFFNPLVEECVATAVLAGDWQGHRVGKVIGALRLQDRLTKYTLRALKYGEYPDNGTAFVSGSAKRLVSAVKAVTGGNSQGAIADSQAPIAKSQEPRANGRGGTAKDSQARALAAQPGRGEGLADPTPRRAVVPEFRDPRLEEVAISDLG